MPPPTLTCKHCKTECYFNQELCKTCSGGPGTLLGVLDKMSECGYTWAISQMGKDDVLESSFVVVFNDGSVESRTVRDTLVEIAYWFAERMKAIEDSR